MQGCIHITLMKVSSNWRYFRLTTIKTLSEYKGYLTNVLNFGFFPIFPNTLPSPPPGRFNLEKEKNMKQEYNVLNLETRKFQFY